MGRGARRPAAGTAASRAAEPPRRPAKSPSHYEVRNAAARAKLDPLPEGERPGAVTVAAVVAGLSGVANLGLWLAGVEVGGEQPPVLAMVSSALLLVTAWGMWRARYWAVLAFQALLGITLVTVAVWVVIGASAVHAVFLGLVVLIPCGTLFWSLVKAMARIQMPRRG